MRRARHAAAGVVALLLFCCCSGALARPHRDAKATGEYPAGSDPSLQEANAAIAAQAEAAVAAGQPVDWLVTLAVPDEQVAAAQARIISQSAGAVTPEAGADLQARQQVYAAYKAQVLAAGGAASPLSAAVVTEAGAAGAQAGSAVVVVEDYQHLPIMHVSISSAAELERLRANPNVLSVVANGIVRAASIDPASIDAASVGAASIDAWDHIGQPAVAARGYTGAGAVVIVDSGVDYTRSAFGPCTAPGVPAASCKVIYSTDLYQDDGLLDASIFHGTNVAGIIAATAPGVKLIALDVFDMEDSTTYGYIIKAIDWAVANRDRYNITAINLSLGGGAFTEACDTEPLAAAVNSAFGAGIISVSAAGNEGKTNSLMQPACASKGVSVGAVFSKAESSVAFGVCSQPSGQEDGVVCFSNSAPMLTMLAPGYRIAAAGITLSGTSQATPFVTAAVALLASRYPEHSPERIINLLTSTGVRVTDSRNGLVKPRLNLRAAIGISCSPRLTPSSVMAPNAGGSFTLTVTPPTADCTWTVVAPAVSWVRVSGSASGTGPGSITVQVDPLQGGQARSTGVVAAASDGTSSFLVSQAVLSTEALAQASDRRPPVLGRLQGSSGGAGAVSLVWPEARDGQSGVSSYKVVYTQGVLAPRLRCASGTVASGAPTASAGGNMQMTVSGLSAGVKHTFRVCAQDAAGNVAGGRLWRGTV